MEPPLKLTEFRQLGVLLPRRPVMAFIQLLRLLPRWPGLASIEQLVGLLSLRLAMAFIKQLVGLLSLRPAMAFSRQLVRPWLQRLVQRYVVVERQSKLLMIDWRWQLDVAGQSAIHSSKCQ